MTRNTIKLKQFALFCVDLLLLFASIFITLYLRKFTLPTLDNFLLHALHFIPIIATWLILMYIMNMYNLNKMLIKKRGIVNMTVTAFISMLVGFSVFYLFFSSITPRGFLILYTFLSFIFLIVWRYLYTILAMKKREAVSVLFIGYDEILEDIISYLTKDNYFEYKILGIFEANIATQTSLLKSKCSRFWLKDKDEFKKILEEHSIDLIILSDDRAMNSSIKKELFNLMGQTHQFILLHDFYEMMLRKIPIGSIHDTWVLSNIDVTSKQWFFVLKRAFDILFSLLVLCIIFFPSILVAIAIKLDSKGAVFFRQIREGKNGKKFNIIKFRTMKEIGNTFKPTEKQDSRITKFGNILRKTRIDEFPQFINVLKGDMSIIGPRPERPELARTLEEQIPFYRQRLLVRPGITGWDQISGEYHSPSIEDTRKKMQSDLYYIKNCSILLDSSIFLKTIATMFLRLGV